MHQSTGFWTFRQKSRHQAAVFYGEECIFRVENGAVTFLRLRPNGQPVLGREVPMPLYWWQYANHADPERNCGSRIELTVLAPANDRIRFTCTGENASGQVKSIYHVSISRIENAYHFEIEAELFIAADGSWLVTPNPSHGELEFCNFWPEGSFSTRHGSLKKYQACLVQRGNENIRIPHHHLESPDKNNILLQRGDNLAWVLEDDNPVVEILSDMPVEAGICAYMWDVHFGYKICDSNEPMLLNGPRQFTARFAIYGLNRITTEKQLRNSHTTHDDFIDNIPVWRPEDPFLGLTLPEYADDPSSVWPWQFISDGLDAFGRLERNAGPKNGYALNIAHPVSAESVWQFTALGQAFGQPPFPKGQCYYLKTRFRTESAMGDVAVSLRLHRSGSGSVFDLANYEYFTSTHKCSGDTNWTELLVETPPISPAPDRLHLLLKFTGQGECGFGEVSFLRVDSGNQAPNDRISLP